MNLPDGFVQMWDHLRPSVKNAFRESFMFNGSHSKEGSRLTVQEWTEIFTAYYKDLDSWWGRQDPANAELFPLLFYKPKYKRDENGEYIKDSEGKKVEIQYVECRLCHDRVDRDECRGKNNDECSLCWETGTKQVCKKCKTEFIIREQEAKNANKSGQTLRTMCDDCRTYTCHCSEGHKFTVSRRVEDELYWKYRETLWKGVALEDRDYSPYCPDCLVVVKCEECGHPVNISKQTLYNMEKNHEPFSNACPKCKPVQVTCEECGETFTLKKSEHDAMMNKGIPFSSRCPNNPEVEATCERCGHKFTVGKHQHDRLSAEGRLYTLCPKGEMVRVTCKNCGTMRQYEIERYWAEELERRGEEYDCGGHKLFGFFGASRSVEPDVNHRERL